MLADAKAYKFALAEIDYLPVERRSCSIALLLSSLLPSSHAADLRLLSHLALPKTELIGACHGFRA